MLILLTALLMALSVSHQENYRYLVHPRELWEISSLSLGEVQTQLFANIIYSYEHNSKRIRAKNIRMNTAYSYLVTGLLTMIIYSGVLMIW